MNELLLSQIWQAQWLKREALRTSDGRRLRVVYRGRWSFGLGPDFQDALLVFDDGPLLRGDIEVHRDAGDWQAHGHQRDERYARVILHVTFGAARGECRRLDGAIIPHLALEPALAGPLTHFVPALTAPLGVLGPGACSGRLDQLPPQQLPALVREAGWARVRQKAASIEADLSDQTFYASLLDALGYSHNREPMRQLAALLPLDQLDTLVAGLAPPASRARLAAILLGAAGFLPWRDYGGLALAATAPAESAAAWERHGAPWRPPAVTPPTWQLARVRPGNHPARRLLGLADLLARHGPARLPAACLDLVRAHAAAPRRLVQALTAHLWAGATPDAARPALIGADRAADIAVNVLIPYALAWAATTGDRVLSQAAERVMAGLPGGPTSAPVRAMLDQLGGPARLPRLGALEQQGLLHLYQSWCRSRRCYECPIAAALQPPNPAG